MQIAGIILAAGSSSRMGVPKQSLLIDGESLLHRTIETVISSGLSPVLVVLGAYAQTNSREISDKAIFVVNEQWEKGMGSSIKTGISSISSKYPDRDAVIIFVCDQPLLSADHIRAMVEKARHTKKRIIASRYKGTLGVPVYFERSTFHELSQLKDDQGAKALIKTNSPEVASVDFEGGEIDLDTPEDVQSFLDGKH